MAKERNVKVKQITKAFRTKSTSISVLLNNDVIDSTLDTCAFSIKYGNTVFTYFGAGISRTANRFLEEYSYKSDILVFGTYGPSYKNEYTVNAPYLDYCLFLGNSHEYVTKDFYSGKIIDYENKTVRFKLEDWLL